MPEHFCEDTLRRDLCRLNHRGLVIFTLSCAERMLPNYRRFSEENQWGNSSVLRTALDLAWTWLESGTADRTLARKLAAECYNQAPDTADFSTILVSSALDAACSAKCVLDLLLDADVETAVEAASYARDTVDMYVQELEDMPANSPDLESRIHLHPVMQRELLNQRDALESILSGISLQAAVNKWKAPARSSIDIA